MLRCCYRANAGDTDGCRMRRPAPNRFPILPMQIHHRHPEKKEKTHTVSRSVTGCALHPHPHATCWHLHDANTHHGPHDSTSSNCTTCPGPPRTAARSNRHAHEQPPRAHRHACSGPSPLPPPHAPGPPKITTGTNTLFGVLLLLPVVSEDFAQDANKHAIKHR